MPSDAMRTPAPREPQRVDAPLNPQLPFDNEAKERETDRARGLAVAVLLPIVTGIIGAGFVWHELAV